MESMSNPCWIIGVLDTGLDTLTPLARRHMAEADLILGEARFLELFQSLFNPQAERRSSSGHLKMLPEWIETARRQHKRVVLLATGDPLFSGVAGHLHHKLPAGSCQVLPAPSTPQRAFARLGLPWTDARLLSVHAARDGGEWHTAPGPHHPLHLLYRLLPTADKLAVLTSPANSPERIARMLLQLGLGEHYRLVVAERLATDQERLCTDLTPDQVAVGTFAHPNLLILLRNKEMPVAPPAPVLGLPDACFLPDGGTTGLLTKREIRVLVLANLALRPDSIVWDVGAGSGSVGLEAARLAPHGWVYAVEKDPDRCRLIEHNRARLAVTNHQLWNGRAPRDLAGWPDPDALFIGGSDGALPELLHWAAERLRPGGRLVCTLVTLENLALATATLQGLGWSWHLAQVQVSHAQPILAMHRLVPAAPVSILTAWHPAGSGG
ncbi:MAG: precorrin-6y C5,15-methyltransferase (decarboxylating) subunit CbiE [Magnetococcus sp. DMHC-8]